MQQRLISAAVIAVVVVTLFVLGPPWLTLGMALLAALAAYETAKLATSAGLPTPVWFPVVVAPVAVLGLSWALESDLGASALALVAPAIAVVIMLAAIVAFRVHDTAVGLRSWLGTVFASLYPSLLAFAAAFVGLTPQPQTSSLFGMHLDVGRILLLILVLTVWTVDSGAYLSGRTFGRRKMSPHISPNKTWEGAIGGTIAGIVVCTVLAGGTDLTFALGAALGLVIAVFGQAGDLAESVLKRAAGAKDSGTLIPGHGGFLDRVDSFLFAAPAMYATLAIYGVVVTSSASFT
jgi:phosphatidate cytidylyltransferase